MTPEIEEFQRKLDRAMEQKDVQEAAELIFEIKSNNYHLAGGIDITKA